MKISKGDMRILDSQQTKVEAIVEEDVQVCSHCHERQAEIFQVTGDFCLECWQLVTHTNA